MHRAENQMTSAPKEKNHLTNGGATDEWLIILSIPNQFACLMQEFIIP
jgi:hypothetical protein